MIPIIKTKEKWQEAFSNLVTDPKELFQILNLDAALLPKALAAANLFPLRVTRSFVARMQAANPHDPLLRQVLPLEEELLEVPGYSLDPLEEKMANPIPGLLKKYHGRVLVTLTQACLIHCRYCFRRHFPYKENQPGKTGWEKLMAYIKEDTSISEVILSGGDPLSVPDHVLKQFSEALKTISHVKTLRIHSRIPIVLPERISTEFLSWVHGLHLKLVMVIHANHPQEINEEVRETLLSLSQAGVAMLNQSVLLKGVNDCKETLIELSHELFSASVLPYYLHLLDKVQGAAHFDLPRERALELHHALYAALPGYLVPRLAFEQPGAFSKVVLTASF